MSFTFVSNFLKRLENQSTLMKAGIFLKVKCLKISISATLLTKFHFCHIDCSILAFRIKITEIQPMSKTVLSLVLLLIIQVVSHAQFKGSYKVSSGLLASLDSRNDEKIFCHVLLADQVNLDSFERHFNESKMPYHDRAVTLVRALKQKAASTQGQIIHFLLEEEEEEGGNNAVRPYWITNAISFHGSSGLIKKLAARDDVLWIGENVRLAQTSYETVNTSASAPDDIENGLVAINAPAMWALGYTGYGTTIFTADTGVDPTHPAIRHQYHGNYFPQDQAWYPNPFEPEQAGRGPFDCSNHGTHVTGTAVGLDRATNDTIGVAFNATWIGGAILCGIGTADNIGAFEWAVDPDGNENTTDDMPDVINNSWYDPSLNELDCYSIYVPILQTLELVGVAVVFSAGNEGPDPGTITQPHNININEVNTFTVGALNGNTPALPIASFSSRGPSHCEGEGSIKIKPEISAPGVQVRSCVPGNNYALLNGTSMAAPHVSGAILLLKEAFPYLGGRDFKEALYRSCTDLGDEGEDNVFGMGIINVYAAYEYLLGKGYVPVNPRQANDAILLEVKHAVMGCNELVRPFILIENAGIDTIRQLSVEYGSDILSNVFDWSGQLGPGERTHIHLPAFSPGEGFIDIHVNLASVNGETDAKPLNNRKSLSLTVTDRQSVAFEMEWENNICSKSDFILTSPLGSTGNHETKWFDAPFDGVEVFEGNLVRIEADSLPPSLYAEIIYKDNVGIPERSTDQGYFEPAKNTGLVFDALADITLESFTIYSEQKHNTEFIIIDEKGETIHSTTRPNIPAGERTITVNWHIPQGKNYRLLKKLGRGLWFDTENISFPYKIDNILNVTSGIKEDSLISDYTGFFNLKVRYVEPCGRLPYEFKVRDVSVSVKAEFEVSADTLLLPSLNVLAGRPLVTGYSSVHWDMGDGTAYNEDEVEHEYINPGTYLLCFHVIDTNQCFTAGVKEIIVLESSSSNDLNNAGQNNQPWLYPNPAGQFFTLVREIPGICRECPVMMYDSRGDLKLQETWTDNSPLDIDIRNWTSGMYIVKIFQPESVVTLKLIRL